jgi:acyl-[acyl-carrier-protein]-phospholipid O-acyltransferase/long-chain-fatty-acid--[acyl-carrier-protein] ligase
MPQLVSSSKLVSANAYIAAFTYLGIILGTGFASVLATITNESFPWMVGACIFVAILGVIFSYLIPPTAVAKPDKMWPIFLYNEIPDALREMKRIPLMLTAVFCYSYFLFIAAYVQMNIVPYAISELGMSAAAGGYLFLFTSIGVGIGALIASKLSGEFTSLPVYGVGMSLICFLFTLIPHPYWINIIWLIVLGMFAGLFLVPPQAFIVIHSAHETKGRNVGTANFFSFIAALIAAAVLYILNTILEISPAWSFTWIGMFNLLVCFGIYLRIRIQNV